MRYVSLALVAFLMLQGCASHPDKMSAASVSDTKYMRHSCSQMRSEKDRIYNRTKALYTQLYNEAGKDAAQMAIGLLVFWPALFLLEGGDGPEAVEYRQLKGDYQSLQKASIKRGCKIKFPELYKKAKA